MRARLDCEAKYQLEADPWGIGQADSQRYDLYVETIRAHARARGSVLDVGCGFGAMLARLRPDFERLHGIELSADAIAKGVERHPFISFERGSIDELERTKADRQRFDAIVFSDVVYYVDEAGRRASLRWIAEHLHRDGFAFIAAYCPGGREYPTPEELRTLVARELVIERDELLDSEHLMLLARPRRRLAALTLDYETWQPVPAGRRIDWDADVFEPTDALLDACDAERARLTIFAELGEHAYLREHEPQVAARMEAQWRDAVERGHDVQMHLHPNWLPELGARREDGSYVWNELLTRAADHPDLIGLVGRLKRTLEEVIRPVDPAYATVAFRAGGYEAQPFRSLAQALCANGLWCDSSVYRGGRQPGVHHDYRWPFDTHQPWFASHVDPQLQAPPAERGIVELPVATFARNDRWTFDTTEGACFGDRLLAAIEAERTAGPDTEVARTLATARALASAAYDATRARRRFVNRVLPRALAHALLDRHGERLLDDDFYVAVGHSKADLDIAAIRDQLGTLRKAGVEVIGLAQMAQIARKQLERHAGADSAAGAAGNGRVHARALDRRGAMHGDDRHDPDDAVSARLRAMIPLDRTRVLDLSSVAADPLALPFADGAFDCVFAHDALEHVLDADAALAEARRVLADGGLLLAAIPADAYGTRRPARGHTWKTSSADVVERLRHAGFLDVGAQEVDAYRLGAAPYAPASDRMLYIRAWRRQAPLAPVERVDALRRWTHEHLDPSRRAHGLDDAGHANGAGMTLVLREALAREGYEPSLITMVAHEHPRGHGSRLQETHDVVELTLADRSVHVLDPMADVRFPYSLQALIDDATLADSVDRARDSVYRARGYDLYATSFWYRRVVAVAARSQPRGRQRFVPARWAARAAEPRYQALALIRASGWRAIRRARPA
jgi:SAM-dependent methyltransferase